MEVLPITLWKMVHFGKEELEKCRFVGITKRRRETTELAIMLKKDNYSYKRISEMLDISIEAAKGKVKRGREK